MSDNKMRINASQQLKEPIGSARRYTVNETLDEGSYIQGEVHLLRTNRSILVTGELQADRKEICSRCIEAFEDHISLNIEEEYMIPRHTTDEVTSDSSLDVGTCVIDENNILDLSEAIRQHILMATSMKPICKEDCAGLCSSCGSNLNSISCNCIPIHPDSPWAPLQALLQREQAEGTVRKG